MRWVLGLVLAAAGFGMATAAVAAPEIVAATYLGSEADDRIGGVAVGPDGTLYVAGVTGAAPAGLPAGAATRVLGEPAADWAYGSGFVARLSADGRQVLAWTRFAPGACLPTSVAVGPAGVYVGVYGSPGLAPVVRAAGGLFVEPHGFAQRDLVTYCPGEHHSEPRRRDAHDQRGVPAVLRFGADLARVEAATWLEGWQSCWHVPWPLGEDHWQPVGLAVVAGGDVVVAHDGGYNRTPPPGQPADFDEFYGVPDHVSRLGPDLGERRWRTEVYTPPTDPAKVNRYQSAFGRSAWTGTWTRPDLGNTRVLRLRAASGGAVVLCGWSPTRTANEPWWSPFLWQLGPDGTVAWRAYNPDPMGGGSDRMGGQVSDACVRTVAVDEQGRVLVSLTGDGGNNVLRWDPRDYTKRAEKLKGSVSSFSGRTLFWGGIARLNPATREVEGGNHLGGLTSRGRYSPAWIKDLAPLPGGWVLAAGRHREGFRLTEDAWDRGDVGGFVRVYTPEMDAAFSSTLPDVDPLTVAWRGRRVVLVGVARPLPAPRRGRGDRPPAALVREALCPAPLGGADGYVLVLEAGPAGEGAVP